MMNLSTSRAVLCWTVLLGTAQTSFSQEDRKPALNEILQRLQANLDRYDTRVPSLFCDEHVVSRIDPAPRNQSTTTDSIFRLKRNSADDGTSTLLESRDIRLVNGKPATSQEMKGPSLLHGAFEGGLAVVSAKQAGCMRYALQRRKKAGPSEPYAILFTTSLTPENMADCLLQEKSSGRVLLEPATMQIKHLELITPRHTIIPGDAYSAAVIGKRTLSIDYAPVELGGDTFWMPSTIAMYAISGERSFHKTAWSYQASYSNYHRLQVSSHIVPKPE